MHKKIKRDNGTLHIIGNGHYIPYVYYWELTDKEKSDLDWATEDDTFFRYKGNTYCLSEFMRADGHGSPFSDFDGYHSDSFFSGILIRFPTEENEEWEYVGEYLKAYWYYS